MASISEFFSNLSTYGFNTSDKKAGKPISVLSNGRNYYAEIPPEESASASPELKQQTFKSGECYFSVRLVEMRLAQATNLIVDYLPICIFYLRYNESGQIREHPYIVSYETIKKALGSNAPQTARNNVLFRDVYVAQNLPFNSSSIEMFVGLCRLNDSSITRGILDFVSETLSVLGGPLGGAIVTTGKGVLEPLGKLFNVEGVELRFGAFDANALRTAGYRVLAASDAEAKLQGLQLVDGVLHRTTSRGKLERVDDVDYLVLAFEHRPTLGDDLIAAARELPFHGKWIEMRNALLAQNTIMAKASFQQLLIAVNSSPLLTERDRMALLAAYAAHKDRFSVIADHTRAPGDPTFVDAVADKGNEARRNNRLSQAPLEAARGALAKTISGSAASGLDPLEDAALARTFSSLVKSLGGKGVGRGPKGNGTVTNGAAPAFSEASRELLAVALADSP